MAEQRRARRDDGNKADRLFRTAGVPDRYREARVEHLSQHQAAMRKWADRAAKEYAPLVMLGAVGTGKTYAAVAGLRLLCDRGVQGLFGSEADFLREIRESWDTDEIAENAVFKRWASAQMLVLDDLGAGAINDNDKVRVQGLIAHRYDHKRTTVFVSNLRPDELLRTYYERVYDRMRDAATQLTFNGPSLRKPA